MDQEAHCMQQVYWDRMKHYSKAFTKNTEKEKILNDGNERNLQSSYASTLQKLSLSCMLLDKQLTVKFSE